MPQGYTEWPGPTKVEEGETYTRSQPTGDGNVFVVESTDERDDGRIEVVGHYEVIN